MKKMTAPTTPTTEQQTPQGELITRTLAIPANTNSSFGVFGGWLMSQMDIAGAIPAREMARGRVTTVHADISFLRPVVTGDVVCFYARCVKRGTTSLGIGLEVWIQKSLTETFGQFYKVAGAVFTYVAVDADGKPRPLPAA